MSWDDPFFWPHKVRIRDLRSHGPRGPVHEASPGRTIRAEVRDEQRLVRTADGSQVVSSASVTIPLPANVPLGSLVTVWPDTPAQRESMVLAVAQNLNGDSLDDFLVVSLK